MVPREGHHFNPVLFLFSRSLATFLSWIVTGCYNSNDEICHIQNVLTKHHLHRLNRYRSMICSRQIQSSKCRYNSNETLLKTNESIERTYGLNHISVPLELNPFFVVPHFNGKCIVFWLEFCFQGPALIFRMGWVCAFSCWHHNYKTVSKRDNNISPWGQYQGYKDMDDQRPVETKR